MSLKFSAFGSWNLPILPFCCCHMIFHYIHVVMTSLHATSSFHFWKKNIQSHFGKQRKKSLISFYRCIYFSSLELHNCYFCAVLFSNIIDRTKAVTQHFLENSFKQIINKKENKKWKIRKTQKYMFSKCLLRHDVVRVFVSSLVLVFVRAILSWCP